MLVREIQFDSKLAYHLWLQAKGNNVTVVYQSDLINDFGYETSLRLERPKIIIRYVDLNED